MHRLVLVLVLLLLAPLPAVAQTFQALLGDRPIGTVTFARSGQADLSLTSDMTDTPLGVGDGTVRATSRPARLDDGSIVTQYVSAGRTSRKSRDISVLFDGGTVIDTVVTPADERTGLSDPGMVPAGVIDPVAALGRLVEGAGCPAPFAFYDGRRVVAISTAAERTVGGATVCDLNYTVTDGPGHLSPLRFRTLDVTATYSGGGLRVLTLGAGGFELRLVR